MSPRQKEKYRNNDPSDFDLDQYIEEQSKGANTNQSDATDSDSRFTSRIKNALLILALGITSVLWYYDWSPASAWYGLFGQQAETVTRVVNPPDINVEIPEIPEIPEINIPDISSVPGVNQQGPSERMVAELEMSMTEYLAELNNQNLLGDKLSSFDARALYNANIPIKYLQTLDEAGYLSEFSYVDIISFYRTDIPFDYLNGLKEANLLSEFSYIEVISFYSSEIPMSYLNQLKDAGFLSDLSYIEIISFHKSGVTTEFLNELKSNGLYDELNYIDIVELFKNDGGN